MWRICGIQQKLLELISEFSKPATYKTNMQKIIVFIYWQRTITIKLIVFTVASKYEILWGKSDERCVRRTLKTTKSIADRN